MIHSFFSVSAWLKPWAIKALPDKEYIIHIDTSYSLSFAHVADKQKILYVFSEEDTKDPYLFAEQYNTALQKGYQNFLAPSVPTNAKHNSEIWYIHPNPTALLTDLMHTLENIYPHTRIYFPTLSGLSSFYALIQKSFLTFINYDNCFYKNLNHLLQLSPEYDIALLLKKDPDIPNTIHVKQGKTQCLIFLDKTVDVPGAYNKYPIFCPNDPRSNTYISITLKEQQTHITQPQPSALPPCLPYPVPSFLHDALKISYCIHKLPKTKSLEKPLPKNNKYYLGIHNSLLLEEHKSILSLNHLPENLECTPHYIILSDNFLPETPTNPYFIIQQLKLYFSQYSNIEFILIGSFFYEHCKKFPNKNLSFYLNETHFLNTFSFCSLSYKTLCLKGMPGALLETLLQNLSETPHSTCLKVHLNAVQTNIKSIQKLLLPSTKILLMLKANAYGTYIHHLLHHSLFSPISYIGVAYVSEGVQLRKQGVSHPIMVMHYEAAYLEQLTQHHLEPVLISCTALQTFAGTYAGTTPYPVHLKIDTGMHRTGFKNCEIEQLIFLLKKYKKNIYIKSIFSHLVGAENQKLDNYSQEQYDSFQKIAQKIEKSLDSPIIKHICNTNGVLRHPHLQLDMVRIGMGLYGYPNPLCNALTLTAGIAQIKKVKQGSYLGYNQRGCVHKDSLIATIRIGYADGYPRILSNKGWVLIKGQKAPITGAISMDCLMVDVTDIPDISEKDTATLFGDDFTPHTLAEINNSIPYELISQLSPRIKRVFID